MSAKGITEDDVVAYVGGICFKTGPPGLVGVESEWLVTDSKQPDQHVALPRVMAAAAAAEPLPARSAVTYEPGGQLEISSLPFPGVSPCHAALRADLCHLDGHLARAGLRISGSGIDPIRSPVRQLDDPRYAAMEAYFDACHRAGGGGAGDGETAGHPGRVMMCSTASIQVCLDIGGTLDEASRRWQSAYALGPVLVASFANSPLCAGRATGWRSTRQAVWADVDPARTRPPDGNDPVAAWSRYALDAPVMALRRETGPWLAYPGMTFREWLRAGSPYGYPSHDDLAFHLSTLFPPVRPSGRLELRMIDAQSPMYWPVPLAVATALLDDPRAAEIARAAAEPVAGRWLTAARAALTDPALAASARTCFAAALDALPRLGADTDLLSLVREFADRYVDRGRCPADDGVDRNAPLPPPVAAHPEEVAS